LPYFDQPNAQDGLGKENMKKEKIRIDGEIYLIYCGNCMHTFFDSFNKEKIKDKNWDTIFVCPFCKSKWLVK
jgi:Zn finger protein HypA/HybF involved in hydrogenase expression